MPAGRPSKYDPEYCDLARSFMGRGFSLTAFAGELGVNRDTVVEWQHAHPEFSVAVKDGQAGRTKCLEEGLLAEGQLGPQVTARIFALKNAAPDEWRDKHEISGPDGGPIQVSVVKFTDDENKS